MTCGDTPASRLCQLRGCDKQLGRGRAKFCSDKHAVNDRQRRLRQRSAAIRAFDSRPIDKTLIELVDRDSLTEFLSDRDSEIIDYHGAKVRRDVAECFDEDTHRGQSGHILSPALRA
jgi:hypothetical protein